MTEWNHVLAFLQFDVITLLEQAQTDKILRLTLEGMFWYSQFKVQESKVSKTQWSEMMHEDKISKLVNGIFLGRCRKLPYNFIIDVRGTTLRMCLVHGLIPGCSRV